MEPKWTEKQEKWIDSKIPLPQLLTTNLKTISRIDDFRRKYLLRYWGQRLPSKCPLCQEGKHSAEQILTNCRIVKIWENNSCDISKRNIRKSAFMNHLDPNHIFSWIYNWCIWKNFWEVIYKKFKNSQDESTS